MRGCACEITCLQRQNALSPKAFRPDCNSRGTNGKRPLYSLAMPLPDHTRTTIGFLVIFTEHTSPCAAHSHRNDNLLYAVPHGFDAKPRGAERRAPCFIRGDSRRAGGFATDSHDCKWMCTRACAVSRTAASRGHRR
eukprot:8591877-Alexandrium_andersonii.AAC.1